MALEIANLKYQKRPFVGISKSTFDLVEGPTLKFTIKNYYHARLESLVYHLVFFDDAGNFLAKSRPIPLRGLALSSEAETEIEVDEVEKQTQLILIMIDFAIFDDLKEIRKQIVDEQNKRNKKVLYPDPCGVILLKSTGEYVIKGTPIIRFRRIDDMVDSDVSKMYKIKDSAMNCVHHDMEVIS